MEAAALVLKMETIERTLAFSVEPPYHLSVSELMIVGGRWLTYVKPNPPTANKRRPQKHQRDVVRFPPWHFFSAVLARS